jgi:HK97 family phage major capsid protein
VGETGSRTATTTPSLREVTPTHGELYAYPQASEWSLDDVFFDVESWLAENVAYEFSVLEGDAVIRGNGKNRPTGMLNTAPTNAPDAFPPTRNAAAYQYIPTTVSAQITPDSLITLTFAVNSEYRANAHWAMNSATLGVIRKFKEATTKTYLYQPGLIAGQPNLLLGHPIRLWEQMDDIAADTHPVAFGDFRRAYVLVDRVGLRITRDNVTNPGHVRFYVRRREGVSF